MNKSFAGPDDGIESPEDINVLNIREEEDSHGSPFGEAGLIVLWDGNGYDSDTCWISCETEMVCDLGYWE